MAFDKQDREIDGHAVTCIQIPAEDSLSVLFKLTKMLGVPLFRFLKGFVEQVLAGVDAEGGSEEVAAKLVETLDDSDFDIFEQVVDAFAERLDEAMAFEVIYALFKHVTVDNMVIDGREAFNRAFSGEVLLVFKVLRFALEVNYRGFSEGSRAALGNVTQMARSAGQEKSSTSAA